MTEPRIVSLPLSALRGLAEATGAEVALRTVDEFKHRPVQSGIDDALFGTTQDIQVYGEIGAWKATPPVWAKLIKQAKDGLHLLDDYMKEITKLGREVQDTEYHDSSKPGERDAYDKFLPEAGDKAIKLIHKAADLWDKKYAPKLQPIFHTAHDIALREQRSDFGKDTSHYTQNRTIGALLATMVPIVPMWEGYSKADLHDLSKDIRGKAAQLERARAAQAPKGETSWVQDAVYYYGSALDTEWESGAGHEYIDGNVQGIAAMLAWIVVLLPKLAFAMKEWGEGAIERAIVANKPMPQGVVPPRKRGSWDYDMGRTALSWAKKALTPTPARELPQPIRDTIKALKGTADEMTDILTGSDWQHYNAHPTDPEAVLKILHRVHAAMIYPRILNVTEPLAHMEGAQRAEWDGPIRKLRDAVTRVREMVQPGWDPSLPKLWFEKAGEVIKELEDAVAGRMKTITVEDALKTASRFIDQMYRGEFGDPRTPFPTMADGLLCAAQLLPYLYSAAKLHADSNPPELDLDAGKVGPWALRLVIPAGWRRENLNKRGRDIERDRKEKVQFIHQAATVALKLYHAAGVGDRSLAGPIFVLWRDPDSAFDQKGAAGWYASSNNELAVYADALGVAGDGDISLQDAVWTLIHELAHRVYYRGISTNARNFWTTFIQQLGEPMSPELKKIVIATALQRGAAKGQHPKVCNGRDCTTAMGTDKRFAVKGLGEFDPNDVLHNAPEKDKSFASTIWWWYEDRHPHEQFIDWLNAKKYTHELPTEYANVTPIEAWPEAVANTLLARPRSKEGRNTSDLVRAVIHQLFKQTRMEAAENEDEEPIVETPKPRTVRMSLAKLQEQVVATRGGLGLKRDELPQIDSNKIDDFLSWLREQGIVIIPTEATARLLLPSQGELESDKVAKFKKSPEKLTQGKIITANDGYILDGHHRWGAFVELYPEGNLPTWQVGLPIRELITLAMSYDGTKVRDIAGKKVSESLTEAAIEFTSETVKKLRADYLMLMKNVPRVNDAETFETFGEGVKRFKQYCESIFYGAALHGGTETPFIHAIYSQNRDQAHHYHDEIKRWDAELRKAAWNFTIELSAPGYSSGLEHRSLGTWLQDRDRWKARVDRAARGLWKELDRLSARVTSTFGKAPVLRGGHDAHEVLEIEGVKVILATKSGTFAVYNGDKTDATVWRAAFKHFRERAERVLPWLWQHRLPVRITSAGIGAGGNYQQDIIEIAAHTESEGFKSLTHIYAHEMGHHAYRVFIHSGAAAEWSAAIKSDKTQLDLRPVLAKWPANEATMLGYAESLRHSDPVLSIHLETLAAASDKEHAYLGVPAVWGREDLEKIIADGTTHLEVPAHPITWYASKNTEEAFCEALGRLVAYGPRAVHPLIQSLLRRTIGSGLRLGESTQPPARTVSVPLRDLRK